MKSITINADCMDVMRGFADKQFELAIVDPPYFKGVANANFFGASHSKNKHRGTRVKRLASSSPHWDNNIPTQQYFDELLRVSKHQIVWGINYYPFDGMPVGRIVWDKINEDSTFSHCELASCSLISSVKLFRFMWNGMIRDGSPIIRIHPTEKPVALYRWLLKNYAKPGDKILDTHLGSGSSRIAAHEMGYDFTGIELDRDYFEAQERRWKIYKSQGQLFPAK